MTRGARPWAVVCLSGGLDSCVTLAEARIDYDVAALHVAYGQRTAPRERTAFDAICDHYAIDTRLIAAQPALGAMGGSALTDATRSVPTGEPGPGVPDTYVPFRNAQILALAVAWAEVLGATAVFLGAVEEDSSGYPDCREDFFGAFAAVVAAGTRPDTHISIETPLLHRTKSQIVTRGVALGAPLHLSWSCYVGLDQACGDCESCHLRRRGFDAAGVVDAIPYARRV